MSSSPSNQAAGENDGSASVAEDLASLVDAPLIFTIRRSRFDVTGPDATRYLHVRLTQDIRSLEPGSGASAFLLNPQGRVQGEVSVICREIGRTPRYTLLGATVGEDERDALKVALLQFKVADQVEVEDRTGDGGALLLVSPLPELLDREVLNLPPERAGRWITAGPFGPPEQDGLAIRSMLGRFTTIELIIGEPERESILARTTLKRGSDETLAALRVLAGAPTAGREITEKVIAPDLPIERHIAFNKGCYTGQEVVEMATTRGRPNRKLRRLFGNGAAPAAGDEVRSASAAVGHVTSVAALGGGTFALLAFVKNDVGDDAPLRTGETDLTADVPPSLAPLLPGT